MQVLPTDSYTRKQRSDHGSRKVETNYDERRKQAYHDRKMAKPFIAWDGEGYTRDGKHFYSLFGNSLGARIERESLTWRDCINLLMASPKEAIHVIFAGTYDVIMMFRDTPIVDALLKGQPVKWSGYRLLFRRGKYLQVTDMRVKGSTRTLFDVFTFFRSSFVRSCEEYEVGDLETLARILSMKSQRNEFTEVTNDVRSYMASELDLLVLLCDSLRDRLALCNIFPSQWHGPGAIASAVLRSHKINLSKGSYDQEFRANAEAAYYGGRFEQFQRGTYLGPVYQYDIRSAYPAAMTHLPNLANIRWTHYTKGTKPHNDYALYHVKSRHIHDAGIGTLPHRNRLGTIYYPSWSYGWYWGIECSHVPLSQRATCWYPTGEGLGEHPFAWVEETYRQRAILKKANQPQQLALKLALNSLYGKLAQSKGATQNDDKTWRYPTFHEVVWAGWITAYTRRRLSDAMHTIDTSAVIATETDSVFATCPIDLTLSESLGDWELSMVDGIRYIQSGVSLVLRKGVWEFKTRGFTVKRTTDEVAVWEKFLSLADPIMWITQTRFGTDPRRKKDFGQWYSMQRKVSLDFGPLEKRMHIECAACRRGESFTDGLHPMIVAPVEFKESVPYKFVWNTDAPLMLGDVLFQDESDPILDIEYSL